METKTLPACPVETTLTLISDKWKVLILRDLLPGTKRFGELKRSLGGVSQKVLTAQLREMEASGLLTRTVYPEVPPRVEYTLTELGRGVQGTLGRPVTDSVRPALRPRRMRHTCWRRESMKNTQAAFAAAEAALEVLRQGGRLTPADPGKYRTIKVYGSIPWRGSATSRSCG